MHLSIRVIMLSACLVAGTSFAQPSDDDWYEQRKAARAQQEADDAARRAEKARLQAEQDAEDAKRRAKSEDDDYKGSSGNRYEYDLNKPVDSIRYETDIGAQMRDQSISPLDELRRERDLDLGQHGGGIKR